jgi:hypothetical protein
MRTALRPYFHIAGFSVFGVDGSRLELPRTASHQEHFSPRSVSRKQRKNKHKRGQRTRRRSGTRHPRSSAARVQQARAKKADCPQLWITTLWHAGSGLPWDWRTGPSDSSERAHLLEMIDSLPEDALVTADAGFVGYEYWKALLDSGRQFLIRVGGNVRLLKKLGHVRESQGTVSLWPDRQAQRQQPPLVLRLVVVHDGRQQWFLVTSVRNCSRWSDRQLAELYRRRWGIELFYRHFKQIYRHFKQTFGRRKLRSHTAENVHCEAAWSVIGLWALLLHAAVHLQAQHVPPERISVARVLVAYRTAMREYKSLPDAAESLWDLLAVAVIDPYKRASKQSRHYPRKKYERPPSPPKITTATKQQIQLAQALRDQPTQKGLTA